MPDAAIGLLSSEGELLGVVGRLLGDDLRLLGSDVGTFGAIVELLVANVEENEVDERLAFITVVVVEELVVFDVIDMRADDIPILALHYPQHRQP